MKFTIALAILFVTVSAVSLPRNFDGREKWKECVAPVYDQGYCNSSWAHAVAGAMSDRYCIKHGNEMHPMSPQDLLCSSTETEKCSGNFDIEAVFAHAERDGVRDLKCLPYTEDGKDCPEDCSVEGADPTRYKCGPMQKLTNIEQIKTTIYEKGPVVCIFDETIDFADYFEGMYYSIHPKRRHTYSTAVKVVGWGYENGMNFWIGETSFSENFGENGFIRLRLPDFCSVAYYCDPEQL
eukprot:TRINITY_DN707_c0_g1_i1.p1 TRINITY_DN707_c0_g1~~TRINITY_DN707_c0_g1_i1.p1  ORF type:complete len:275 (+),score=6.54 TRINITY_DN707_c0_g1_i1:112-825(+)